MFLIIFQKVGKLHAQRNKLELNDKINDLENWYIFTDKMYPVRDNFTVMVQN